MTATRILTAISRRLRLVAVTLLLVFAAKVAAAAMVPAPDTTAPHEGARILVPH